MFAQSGTDSQSVKQAAGRLAAAFDDVAGEAAGGEPVVVVGAQPNSCISGPSVTALSTQRPVMTMSAPAASARAIGSAPR